MLSSAVFAFLQMNHCSKRDKKMKTEQKAVSLRVNFEDEQNSTYVMVATEDIDKANRIAQEWAEKKIRKKATEVVINKGIIDIPKMEADDEYKGYRIWELPF